MSECIHLSACSCSCFAHVWSQAMACDLPVYIYSGNAMYKGTRELLMIGVFVYCMCGRPSNERKPRIYLDASPLYVRCLSSLSLLALTLLILNGRLDPRGPLGLRGIHGLLGARARLALALLRLDHLLDIVRLDTPEHFDS